MIKAAFYARVSTLREEQKNSLHNQELIAERIAQQEGLVIEKKYIESVSGKGFKNRKEIHKLLKDAKNGDFKVLIIKSVSRLSRDVVQSRKIADQIERLGIRLILPEDNYDSKYTDSKLSFMLMAVFAEHESEKLSQRIKMGLRASAREGNYTGSTAPYGYKLNQSLKRLEIDDEYAPIVKQIFNLYLYEGYGMSKIGNYLMDRKIKPPKAAAGSSSASNRWHQQSIKGILCNPHYTGTLVQQRTVSSGHLAESESYRLRYSVNESKQIRVEDTHSQIISHKQFSDVQALMQAKKQNKSNGKKSMFAHIAVCADCGIGMHYKSDRGKGGAYVCGGYVKHTKKFCTSHLIKESKLIDTIREDIISMMSTNQDNQSLYKVARQKANNLKVSMDEQIASLINKYESLDADFDYYVSLHRKEIFSDDQLKDKNKEIEQQRLLVLEQKVRLEKEKENKKDVEANLHAFETVIQNFLSLQFNDRNDLSNIMRRLVDKIVVHQENKIDIYYKFFI